MGKVSRMVLGRGMVWSDMRSIFLAALLQVMVVVVLVAKLCPTLFFF